MAYIDTPSILWVVNFSLVFIVDLFMVSGLLKSMIVLQNSCLMRHLHRSWFLVLMFDLIEKFRKYRGKLFLARLLILIKKSGRNNLKSYSCILPKYRNSSLDTVWACIWGAKWWYDMLWYSNFYSASISQSRFRLKSVFGGMFIVWRSEDTHIKVVGPM